MRAGDLNEIVTLYTRSTSVGQFGGTTVTYTMGDSYKCSVATSRRSLTEVAGAEIYDDSALTVFCRRYVPCNIGDRFLWRGSQYNIVSIIPDRKRAMLTVECSLVNL